MGQEFAMQLDGLLHKVDEIWLIARRKDRLKELAEKLSISARVIPMDVSDEKDMFAFKKLLEVEEPVIRLLINCAGFGLMGKFDEISIEEQLGMVKVNCEALTKMTWYCVPYMKKNSRILQLASSAGFFPQKYFTVYAASKAYVLSFSRALREELKHKKIWVTAVCPGPVATEFFDIAERYGSTLAVKKMTMVSADRVVRTALKDSRDKKAVSVCSAPIKLFHTFTKIIPDSLILGVINIMK